MHFGDSSGVVVGDGAIDAGDNGCWVGWWWWWWQVDKFGRSVGSIRDGDRRDKSENLGK